MQAPELTRFLNDLGSALMAGDTRRVAARFSTPTPVYLNDALMVLGSREIAHEAMEIMYRGFVAQGVHKLEARIAAVELPRGPMQKVWVDWDYRGAGGLPIATIRAEYVLRHPDRTGETMIEMVNYVDFAFPAIIDALPLAR